MWCRRQSVTFWTPLLPWSPERNCCISMKAMTISLRPMAFETNPDRSTRRIFVQLSRLNGFAVIDFATHAEVARIKFPDKLTRFGIAEGREGTPSHGIGVSPDGKTLWVNSTFANVVFVYSLPNIKLTGSVGLPEGHLLEVRPRAPCLSGSPSLRTANWSMFRTPGQSR